MVKIKYFEWFNANILGVFLPFVLFFSGSVLLFVLGRYFLRVKTIFRAITKDKTEKNDGQSSFSALCLALAATLGVGNISGVSAAIILGGAGALFWMWVSAIASAVLKFCEVILCFAYREKNADNSYTGGAFSYIKGGLNAPIFAVFFSICCIFASFTMGNITQAKVATDGVKMGLGIPPIATATAFFLLVLVICLGGGRKISAFTLKIIPILCLAYIICSISVIIIMRSEIVYVSKLILSEAFTPRAGVGGIFGILCSPALRYGIARGVMSNEAGCGTAPIAHASANTENSLKQGLFGVFEVFFDTVLLCTLTGYVVLLSPINLNVGSSTEIAIGAFKLVLGDYCQIFLGCAIFLFALASIVGWGYYGQVSMRSIGADDKAVKIYSVFFALTSFIGCFVGENFIWLLADFSISIMAIINVIALLLLTQIIVTQTKKQFDKWK